MVRRFERSRIRDLLTESHLVTLSGFGGLGKTGLAEAHRSAMRHSSAPGRADGHWTTQARSGVASKSHQQGTQLRASRALRTTFRRERQVADLIAEGLGNREIARPLVISRRTAGARVEST